MPVVYWLLPEISVSEHLRREIDELALRFDAAPFEPHVTICSVPEIARAPSDVLREVTPVTISLEVEGICHSERFTKAIFVQFAQSMALQEVAEAIWQATGAGERPVLNPHLSLLYKELPRKARAELAEEIKLPFRLIRFDGYCAVRCPSPTETPTEVRAWQLIQNSTIRNAG